MSIRNRVVVVALAASVAVVPATAASAGDHGKGKGKGKSASQQDRDGKGAARKAAARAKFTVPGRVTATDAAAGSLRIARKERGVTVVREFVLAPGAVIRRDGARIGLAALSPRDKVVAKGSRVDGRLVVTTLQVEGRRAPAPAPAPVDDSAPTATPVVAPPPTIVI